MIGSKVRRSKGLRKLRLPIPKTVAVGYAKLIRGRSSFFIGLLNGFMPCGPLQSMQIYALSMLLFSLGTVPLMFGFGFLSGKLNGCNGEIIVPAYDIDVKLHEGENLVTFTPQ